MSLIKELEKYVNEVIKDLGYETDVKIEKSKNHLSTQIPLVCEDKRYY